MKRTFLAIQFLGCICFTAPGLAEDISAQPGGKPANLQGEPQMGFGPKAPPKTGAAIGPSMEGSSEVMKGEPIELTGQLESGIVAIGGETTGIQLRSENGKTYELEFKEPASAQKFNGKKVSIRGTIYKKDGLEIPVRYIVRVDRIEESDF